MMYAQIMRSINNLLFFLGVIQKGIFVDTKQGIKNKFTLMDNNGPPTLLRETKKKTQKKKK